MFHPQNFDPRTFECLRPYNPPLLTTTTVGTSIDTFEFSNYKLLSKYSKKLNIFARKNNFFFLFLSIIVIQL